MNIRRPPSPFGTVRKPAPPPAPPAEVNNDGKTVFMPGNRSGKTAAMEALAMAFAASGKTAAEFDDTVKMLNSAGEVVAVHKPQAAQPPEREFHWSNNFGDEPLSNSGSLELDEVNVLHAHDPLAIITDMLRSKGLPVARISGKATDGALEFHVKEALKKVGATKFWRTINEGRRTITFHWK